MSRTKPITLIAVILLSGCNQIDNTTVSSGVNTSVNSAKDQEEIQQLVSRLYEWHETKSLKSDFAPITDAADSLYSGLDLKKHEQRLAELRRTNLFADKFLDNYNKIALAIDSGLKSKNLKWMVGDMPPFGNGANPWCNCQDSPDKYWREITITHSKSNKDTMTFTWTWGKNFAYQAQAVKQNGDWRILYLQGFDPNEFIPTN